METEDPIQAMLAPSRIVKTWRITTIWGGKKGHALPGVTPVARHPYRARIDMWGGEHGNAVAVATFHEPEVFAECGDDEVEVGGVIYMRVPLAMFSDVVRLLENPVHVRVGFADGHAWMTSGDMVKP